MAAGAVGDVQRFIAGSRDQTAEQIQRLGNVTQNIVDHRMALENVLHAAPTAFSNFYNIYNPDTGYVLGQFVLNNFSNPVAFFCLALGAIENTTAPETAKLCAQYLGPAMRLLDFNSLPFPVNPYLMKSARPDNIISSDPSLAPGGAGPTPADARSLARMHLRELQQRLGKPPGEKLDDATRAHLEECYARISQVMTASMQLGNGRWESTQFNSRLQPTQIALGKTQNATDLLDLDYSYATTSNNGNVLSQTITVPTAAGT